MRSMILSILFTAMLVGAGFPAHAGPVPGTLGLLQPEEKTPLLDEVISRAYTTNRWIGVARKSEPDCPDVTGWKGEKLTAQAKRKTKARVEGAAELSSYQPGGESEFPEPLIKVRPSEEALFKKLGLDRICIYTPKEGQKRVEFVPNSGLKAALQDRLAVATTSAGGLPSDPLASRIWQSLATQFTDRTGQVVFEPGYPNVRKAFRFRQQPGVRLTFLDSQPDSQVSGGDPFDAPTEISDSMHGFTLIHLARGIVCPSGPDATRTCAATVESRRALGFGGVEFDPNQPLPPPELAADRRGQVGLVSELAIAIVREVLDWREQEPHKHLILNLSLGWDGEGFKDLDVHSVHKLDPSVRAVYEAIRFARRSGVLVIAAAGNRRGGSETEWPLLPAAWELRRPCWFPLPLGRKPIYAVGGVDGRDLSIPNSRDGGRPRRAAYADHSVTYAEDFGPTAMYTGTSVSAAVTSSIAAVIWHLRPDLRPGQVMKLIQRSGDPLDFQADFYAWKNLWPLSKLITAPQVTKVSLCQAVVLACGQQGSACQSKVAPFAACLKPSEGPDFEHLFKDLPPYPAAWSSLPLPDRLDIQSQRWVYPQPDDTPCPGCTIIAQDPPARAQLVFAWGTEWKTKVGMFTPESARLKIECGGSSYPQQDLTPSLPGDPLEGAVKIDLPDVPWPLTSCTADINFEWGTQLAPVSNPVLIPR